MKTDVSHNCSYALAYAALGWPVFPCGRDKAPRVKNGLNAATCDASAIRRWWAEWPDALIGMATGRSAWVLDVDVSSDKNGFEWLSSVEAKHGEIVTQTAVTGRKGRHYFFSADDRIKCSTNKVAPGIDVRGAGGYVILEPSVSVFGSYAFNDWDVLSKEFPAIEPAPQWLIEKVLAANNKQPSPSKRGNSSARFAEGGRNDGLARVAGSLRRNGISPDGLYTALAQINREQCDPPLDDAEVRRIADSIGRYQPEVAQTAATVHAQAERATEQATSAEALGLELTDKGAVVPHELNILAILERHPTWANRVRFDVFHQRTFYDGAEWTDSDDSRLLVWLQQAFSLRKVAIDSVRRAVDIVARRNQTDEPADWLHGLQWDGVERIDYFFTECFGAADNAYVRDVSGSFWKSMVARILKPGCQVDTIVVLEGKQGIGKSSGLRLIGGEWYGELHESVASKDFQVAMPGKVLLEISELNSFSKAEITRVKQIITCPVDRYRPPYGRRAEDIPRRNVMIGTTNENDYLTDPTGGRRFLPVACTEVRRDLIAENREQLFAEACHKVEAGAGWWDISDAAQAQADRLQEDPWQEVIAEWLVGKTAVRLHDVASDALKLEASQQTMIVSKRIGGLLRRMGWENVLCRDFGKPSKAWKPVTLSTGNKA